MSRGPAADDAETESAIAELDVPGRLDSHLESEGAEFLVLGHLLIEGIPAYKTYARMPGYDLVAVNPDKGRSVRVQVKSRWATDYNRTFLMRNFDCDFVVFVELNRGYRYAKKRAGAVGGIEPPRLYVLPTPVVEPARSLSSKWGKIAIGSIADFSTHLDNWNPIRAALGYPEKIK